MAASNFDLTDRKDVCLKTSKDNRKDSISLPFCAYSDGYSHLWKWTVRVVVLTWKNCLKVTNIIF